MANLTFNHNKGGVNMYLPRLIEKTIKEKLSYIGAIQIEGPKWCGKSTTASRFASTIIKLQDPIVYTRYKTFATTSKADLLYGNKPILFDEWQKIPEIWDFVRLDIDEQNGKAGQYILTGSAKPKDDPGRHSGTGRIAQIKMRPMSLYESKYSSGEVSLEKLFYEPNYHIIGESKLTINDQVSLVCRGGWPGLHGQPIKNAINYVKDYYESLTNSDITNVDGIKRNPNRAKAILRTYARNISTLTDYQTMIRDLENIGEGVDKTTFASYLNAFEKLFVIENIDAWTPNLRSATRIRMSQKKQFVDSSIAAIALGVTPDELGKDMKTFGFFFESMVTRDLKVYLDKLDGRVFHYRDKNELEVDCILKLDDGRWAAVEIKVGGNQLDAAAANLIKLKNKVDTEHMKEPSFLTIIYAGTSAYRRADGIYVVPIGCLKD
jgi:predicted AAA+ superfamily ATPase